MAQEKIPEEPVLAEPRAVPVRVGKTKAMALVYPLGIKQARVHKAKIQSAFATVAGYIASQNDTPTMAGIKAALRDQGVVMTFLDLAEVAADCVVFEPETVKFDQLSHDNLPAIMGEWIDVSFFEEDRYRPWWEMVTKLLRSVAETAARALAKSEKTSPATSSS